MISTGSTGTARQVSTPNNASKNRVKTLLLAAPPRERIASRARTICGASDGIADHLQREIGLHAGAHVERAVLHQRPAAMRALHAAQIVGDLGFECGSRRVRRDSGAAAHIRPEWCCRLPARTPSVRRTADSRAAPASPGRCSSPARRDRQLRFDRRKAFRQTSLYLRPGSVRRSRSFPIRPAAWPEPDRRRGHPTAPIPRWLPATPYQSSRRRETGFSRP